MTSELVDIANQLDQLGLHQEASLIDRFLEKRAGLLSYHEKPFLAALAQILLKVKKYQPEQQVTEDMSLPGSQKSLYGLTRSKIEHLVTEALRRFIETYAKPKLQSKYVGTDLADKYSEFVGLMERTLASLEHTFRGPEDLQRRAKEMGRVVERTRSALDRLLKGTAEDNPLVRQTHDEAHKQLDRLEMAIRNRDITTIEQIQKWFTTTFPAQYSDQIPKPLANTVSKSYATVTTDPHKERIREVIDERFAEEEDVDLYGGWSNVVKEEKRREAEYKKTGRRKHATEQLKELYQKLVNMIIEVQAVSDEEFQKKSPKSRETLRDKIRDVLEQVPGGKFSTPELHEYQNVAKLYSTVKDEIEMMALWLKRYLEFNQIPNMSVGQVQQILDDLGEVRTAAQQGIIVVAEGEEEDDEGLMTDMIEEEELEPIPEPEPKPESKKLEKKKEVEYSREQIEEMKSQLGKEKAWVPGLYIPLAQFLFHTSSESRAINELRKTLDMFRSNLNILSQRAEQDHGRAESTYVSIHQLSEELEEERRNIEREVLWEMWHEKYVKDTFDTIKAFFRPKEVEQKDVGESQREVISGFKQLLGFSL